MSAPAFPNVVVADLAGFDGMVIEAREPLEESEILQILARVDEQRVGIDARRDVPSLAREACDDFVFELIVIAEEQPQRRRHREQNERAHANERDL